MIQEIDGANPEPPRHGHVIVLSAVAASVALVMLALIHAPVTRTDAPFAAASTASPVAGSLMLVGSSSTWVTLDRVAQLPDSVTSSECAAGIGSGPPVHLVFGSNGRVIAAYTSGRAGRFIPLPPGYDVSVWLSVPCDTPDVFAPRMNRAR